MKPGAILYDEENDQLMLVTCLITYRYSTVRCKQRNVECLLGGHLYYYFSPDRIKQFKKIGELYDV